MLARSTVFITVHKGASTFIADDLARFLVASPYFDTFLPVGSLKLQGREISDLSDWPARGLVGIRVYPGEFRDLLAQSGGFPEFAQNAALVFIERDPRDAAVSLFYSKAFSHTTNVLNKERFLEDRRRMQEMTPREGVMELTARYAIAEFSKLHEFHDEHGGLLLRYEDLVTEPGAWFDSLGKYAEWPQELTDAVTAEFSGSFVPPETADPLQHKRRITPGNWREVFDDELEADFDAKIGARLKASGYS